MCMVILEIMEHSSSQADSLNYITVFLALLESILVL